MPNGTLEQRVNAQQDAQQENEEEKPKAPTTSQSVIEETNTALRKSTNYGIGLASLGAVALAGLPLPTPVSFAAGDFLESRLAGEEEFKSEKFRDSAVGGSLFVPASWAVTESIRLNSLSYGAGSAVDILGYSVPAAGLIAGALTLATIPLLNAIYSAIAYPITKKTTKGMLGYFKDKNGYWKDLKKTYKYLGLPIAGIVGVSTVVAMPAWLMYSLIGGLGVGFKLILSQKDLNYWKLLNPLTYLPKPITDFIPGTCELYRKTLNGAYNLGSRVVNFFSEITKQAPKGHAPQAAAAASPA